MSKKKRARRGKVVHVDQPLTQKDVEIAMMDLHWFGAHPGYRTRVRSYIPGEFHDVPLPDGLDLHQVTYVSVVNMGDYRVRMPLGVPLQKVSVILPRSVKSDDVVQVLHVARQLTLHAEVVYDADGRQKIEALCKLEQQAKYEDFLQYVFEGAKRYQD